MASLREAIMVRAGGRGLVLTIDDAHCLDDASAALVHQLAVRTDTRLLMTLRRGEAPPDAIAALWKDGIAERLDLQPLPNAEIRVLLAEALGGPVEECTAWEVTRRCAGNCMFLRELILAAQAAGHFELAQNRWRLTGRLPSGTRLVELVEARTRSLPGPFQELLEHLALGEPLPVSVVTVLVGRQILEDASVLGLVDIDRDPRRATVRLAHPLYGEVLRSGMQVLRARARCRALVTAFESTPLRRFDDVFRFASWSLSAGIPAEPSVLLYAAQCALEGADVVGCERFAAAAVDQLTRHVSPSSLPAGGLVVDVLPSRAELTVREDDAIEMHTQAILALTDALGRQGRFGDASAALDLVHPRAPGSLLATIAELQSVGRFVGAEDDDESAVSTRGDKEPAHVARALAILEEAARRAGGETLLRLSIARARLLGLLARPGDALELLDATAPTSLELEHRWLAVRGPALAVVGRFDDAESAMARQSALAPIDLVAPTIIGPTADWLFLTTAIVRLGRGQLSLLESMAGGMLEHANAMRHPSMQRSAATSLGIALLFQGRITEAIELLIAGTSEIAGLHYHGDLPLAFGALACAYALSGDTASAQSTLDHADRDAHTPIRTATPPMYLGQALTAHAQDLPGHGRDALHRGLIKCRETGQHVFELYLALGACQLAAPDLAIEFTAGLLHEVDGPMPKVAHDWATASIARDACRLGKVSEALEDRGYLLMAATAASAAADLDGHDGRGRQAMAGRARARRLLGRCPGADDLFLRRSQSTTILTTRELEIARHAAMGLSSAEIATRLYVSIRTVDSHLGRIYTKLDVRRRGELRDHPELSHY
jgi:DNA-binding CsgD family transcriptional regulator